MQQICIERTAQSFMKLVLSTWSAGHIPDHRSGIHSPLRLRDPRQNLQSFHRQHLQENKQFLAKQLQSFLENSSKMS